MELCNRELKRLADSHARYHGRFECWSCDDVRKARDAIGDLRREGGLTRPETFASRPPKRPGAWLMPDDDAFRRYVCHCLE